MSDARLNLLDKIEMFDIGRIFNTNLTWEQHEQDWREFQIVKSEHQPTDKEQP